MGKNKTQNQNIGNAGEYYIASRLSAENFIATITLGRAERYDILAVSPNGRTVKLSVKARLLENIDNFLLSEKDENSGANDFYYAFIRLNEFKSSPDFWIVPGKLVGKVISSAHKKWLSGNKKRKDTNMRKFRLKLNTTSRRSYLKDREKQQDWEKQLKKYYKNIRQLK